MFVSFHLFPLFLYKKGNNLLLNIGSFDYRNLFICSLFLALKNSVIYHKVLQKYKEIQCDDLNSRAIRDMSYNLMATNYLATEVLESMYKYLENNYEHMIGETVEKLLTCTYNLGYTPESCESLQYAGQVLLRYMPQQPLSFVSFHWFKNLFFFTEISITWVDWRWYSLV